MGGGSNDSQRQAEQNERERQQQIKQATSRINDVFNDPARDAQYSALASDTTEFFTNDLDRQKAINDRKLKFALARSGQIGGSLQADQSQVLGEDYLRGIVAASRRGQAAEADLAAADEQSRMNLLAMAQGGLDATTGSSRAASAMRNNLESSMAGSRVKSLGDMFANMGAIYAESKRREGENAMRKYDYGTIYKPLYGAGGYRG